MKSDFSRGVLHVIFFLVFLFLGLFQTWPLARHAATAVPYASRAQEGHEVVPLSQGDTLQLIYHFWLFKDALEEGRPFFPQSMEFSVAEEAPAFSPQFFPLSFGYWIFSFLGPAAAYNVMVLISYLLSGLGGYLLCRLFFHRGASLIGGTVFALVPFRYGQLMGGHSNGFVIFLAPLALFLLVRAFRSGRSLTAFASGASFLFLCCTDLTAAYFTALVYFPLLAILALHPLGEWCRRSEGPAAAPPRWIERLPGGSLLPVCAGGAAGFAYHLSVQRQAVNPEWLSPGLLALPFHGLLALLAWRILAVIFRDRLVDDDSLARKTSSALLLPLFLFLLYPLVMLREVPFWGRSLAVVALVASCAILLRVFSLATHRRPRLTLRPHVRKRAAVLVPLIAMTALSLALIAYERKAHISDSSIASGRSYAEVKLYSPAPGNYLSRDLTDAEKALYPGISAILLSALFLGAVPLLKVSGGEETFPLEFFFWSGLFASLLALGPGGEGISPLFRVVRETVPLYGLSRVPSRVFSVAVMALSLGAAGGAALLASRLTPRWRGAVYSVIVILLTFDYRPPAAPGLTILPAENDIYRLAAEESAGGRIMDVPIWPGDSAWSSSYLYYATLYGTRTINGYSPMVPASYFDTVFRPLEQINLGQLGSDEFRRLQELRVSHLVFHEDAFPPQVSPYPAQFSVDGLLASPYLEFRKRSGPLWLFRLRGEPGPPFRSAAAESVMGKIYDAEDLYRPPGTLRRGEGGALLVDFAAGEARSLNRRFPGKGFYPAGRYRLQALFEGRIGDERGEQTVKVVNRDSGETVMASSMTLPLPASYPAPDYQSLEGVFVLEEAEPIDFEILSDGRAPVSWDLLSVVREERDAPSTLEAEDLIHMGLTVANNGGRAVQLLPHRDPADYVLLGPDRIYLPGNYRATLRFGEGSGATASAGRFEALVTNSGEPLAKTALTPGTGEAELTFSLFRPAPLRFRVFYNKRHELLLDNITLERTDGVSP